MPRIGQRRGNLDLGAVIRAARSARGLSREELGVRLGGVHRDTIGAWERGDWLPGPQNVPALARVLELPAARLEPLLVGQCEPGGVVAGDRSVPGDRLSVAGWREVVGWGWSTEDLLEHLVALDGEAYGRPLSVEEAREAVAHWAPLYAQIPECWRVICSEPRHVVANWTFFPLVPDAYAAYRAGELLETAIVLEQLDLPVVPGLYRAVCIDFVIRPSWTTAGVRMLLFRSLFRALAELARLGIFFGEVAAHAQTAAGKGLCRGLGMTRLGQVPGAPGTEVFVLPLVPLAAPQWLARDAELAGLYRRMPGVASRSQPIGSFDVAG